MKRELGFKKRKLGNFKGRFWFYQAVVSVFSVLERANFKEARPEVAAKNLRSSGSGSPGNVRKKMNAQSRILSPQSKHK